MASQEQAPTPTPTWSASQFNGLWRLYGTENGHLFAESFDLPTHIASAMVHLRILEEVHVNGNDVHIRLEIPSFNLPGYTVEKNATFGEQCTAPLISTGSIGCGLLQKVSETLWVANLTSAETGSPITVTREIIGGEMWVTVETRGTKMIRKYERSPIIASPVTGDYAFHGNNFAAVPASCIGASVGSTAAAIHGDSNACAPCPTGEAACEANTAECLPTCSPFAGTWSLYGTEGSNQFYSVVNVPETIRNLLGEMRIFETIHVNGDRVHIRICVAPLYVPARASELHWTFASEHDYVHSLTSAVAKMVATKESETKWISKVTGFKGGDMTVIRELVNDEMWLTFENAKGKMIRKFERYDHPQYDHEHHEKLGHHKRHDRHGHHSHHGHHAH